MIAFIFTCNEYLDTGSCVCGILPNFGKYCKGSPSVHCSCGIYAADSADAAQSYGTVTGQISGWGRYVRGTAGWRRSMLIRSSFC